jgi:transmembrane sensor
MEERLAFLFRRYLSNTITAAELDELLAIIDKEENKTALLQQLKLLWENNDLLQEPDVNWERLYNRMMTRAGQPNVYPTNRRRFTMYRNIAAAIVLVAGLTAAGWYFLKNERTTANVTAVKETTTNKSPGHQLINLPDGSIVILNAGSKLDYPASFKGKNREVHLTGEAYFDIRHVPSQPFVVHAGGIATKVLGTAFNIKAYPVDNTISVTVAHGKVEVTHAGKTLGVLKKNQQLVVDKIAQQHQQHEVNAATVSAWKQNDFIMEDRTFAEAARLIADRFHVTIELDNPGLANCRFTATFLNNASLEQVLTVLCDLNNVSFSKKEENIYVIKGEGCDQ